jgi:hypothetical protein
MENIVSRQKDIIKYFQLGAEDCKNFFCIYLRTNYRNQKPNKFLRLNQIQKAPRCKKVNKKCLFLQNDDIKYWKTCLDIKN